MLEVFIYAMELPNNSRLELDQAMSEYGLLRQVHNPQHPVKFVIPRAKAD